VARVHLAMLVGVLLAGCAASPDAPVASTSGTPEPAPVGAGDSAAVLLLEGEGPWRDESPPDMAFELAFQTVFGICEWPGGHNPDISQFHLSGRFPHGPLPEGTTAFRVQADWTDADHLGAALRFVAISPAGNASVQDFAPRGAPVDVPLSPRLPSSGDWDLWLCTVGQVNPSGTPATQSTFPYLGDVAVRVEAVGLAVS
jgi:hypothetical protein